MMADVCRKRLPAQGFTLIELLIVIAIILILIAIALPNFLEAQLRAKVVHVKGNLRTIGIALASYRIDWKKMMPFEAYNMWIVPRSGTPNGEGKHLTFPIKYLSYLPPDPFNMLDPTAGPGSTNQFLLVSFGWFYTACYPTPAPGKICKGNETFQAGGREKWSIGKHVGGIQNDPGMRTKYLNTPLTWLLQSPGPDRQGFGPTSGTFYSATNGTVSKGDMWYFENIAFGGG